MLNSIQIDAEQKMSFWVAYWYLIMLKNLGNY